MWHLNYTAVEGRITSVSKTKSNGSVAGIAAMSNSQMFGFSFLLGQALVTSVNTLSTNFDDFIDNVSRNMARNYLSPIAGQASPRPAELVQIRTEKIVTEVPKTAVWLLASANIIYIILAVVLAIIAWSTTSPDVYQLRTRLSVVGLAAQLFEGTFAERAVKDEKDLFENHDAPKGEQKRVMVRKTEWGGTAFGVVQ